MSRRLLIVCLAALISSPVAAATWYVHGTAEPDTSQDESQGYMFANPNVGVGEQAYFNA